MRKGDVVNVLQERIDYWYSKTTKENLDEVIMITDEIRAIAYLLGGLDM
jgi:hypothetical protein